MSDSIHYFIKDFKEWVEWSKYFKLFLYVVIREACWNSYWNTFLASKE